MARELSIKHLPKEMFGGFTLGFLTISLSILILFLLGYYEFFGISTSNYSLKLFGGLMVAALIEDLFIRGLIIREGENWLGTNFPALVGVITSKPSSKLSKQYIVGHKTNNG